MNKDVSPILSSDYYINQNDEKIKGGCYICSIAMIVCWYLNDSSSSTKKDILNQLLGNCDRHGNYSNADIKYNNRTFRIDRNISDMSQKLLDGYPSICQVPGHFVVINGYDTNKSGMDAYIVLDPGYKSHKTLQDTMNRYKNEIRSKRFIYEV